MRRMLDPKEVGGSTAPERHCYRIDINNAFHYIVYTTKNYGWPIGKMIVVGNFDTSDKYAELRAVGCYSAGGVYTSGSSATIVNYFEINGNNKYTAYGYNLATKEYTEVSVDIITRQMSQLF